MTDTYSGSTTDDITIIPGPASIRHRPGGWLPHDRQTVDDWLTNLRAFVGANPQILVPPIVDFHTMVEDDPALNLMVNTMFAEAAILKSHTPLGTPSVVDFDEFLILLNAIMTQAPQFTECPNADGSMSACGLIGFPINALLDWPMATNTGYEVFSNQLVNQQLKKILQYWSEFLTTADSQYVLVDNFLEQTPKVIAWLSADARQAMVDVACQPGDDPACKVQPFEHFFQCDPSDPYYGYSSWDDFFTRKFNDDVRPVAAPNDDTVINNACESGPLQVVSPASLSDTFWAKGMPYSLENMMDFDPLAAQFDQGTVYQAFLSALSYHRWNSPVNGTVVKTQIVNGTYYLENRYEGFANATPPPAGGPDPSAPNSSQPFLSAVATRAIIFIEADGPIGLMCFIAIGMAEVSSCEITVTPGQPLCKGDELGMFHFGGSTHCLIFRPGVNLAWDFPPDNQPNIEAQNLPVKSQIAHVVT